MASEDTYPLFLHRLAEVESIITDPKFKCLVNSSIHNAPWIPHQLLFNIQNYFKSITLITTKFLALRNTPQQHKEMNLQRCEILLFWEQYGQCDLSKDGYVDVIKCT